MAAIPDARWPPPEPENVQKHPQFEHREASAAGRAQAAAKRMRISRDIWSVCHTSENSFIRESNERLLLRVCRAWSSATGRASHLNLVGNVPMKKISGRDFVIRENRY